MLRIAYDPVYMLPLPEDHRFPMIKYELIPQQLIREGVIVAADLFAPLPADEHVLRLTHTADYLEALKHRSLDAYTVRRIGFPLTEALYLRERVLVQGTIDCALFAMKYGIALNIAGGTHHAFRDRGEGFCLMNDMAVAANYLLHERLVKKILVVDLDVHQGNGTAKIFDGDDRVFTFSMHGKHNYPFRKEHSDLDIELPDGIKDDAYLRMLEAHLSEVIRRQEPEMVFYQSGVDILESDRYGRLAISPEGCRDRDSFVFSLCKKLHVPVVAVMGGGYSRKISDIVNAHCNTFRCAVKKFTN